LRVPEGGRKDEVKCPQECKGLPSYKGFGKPDTTWGNSAVLFKRPLSIQHLEKGGERRKNAGYILNNRKIWSGTERQETRVDREYADI